MFQTSRYENVPSKT